jgi:molecular chaperone DnaJ
MNVPHFNDAQSVFDLFGDLFGDFFGRPRGPQAGRDLQVIIDLELAEAARGVTRTVHIPRDELCPECSGSGSRKGSSPAPCRRCNGQGVVIQAQGFFRVQQTCRACGGRGAVITDPCPRCNSQGRVTVKRTLEVAVPPGVDTGTRIRLPGEGEAGDPRAPRGDLFCVIRVREHPMFQRDGNNLVCQVPVTFSQAALGGEIQVPTLDGLIPHQLKRGLQSGNVVRISGLGMPSLRGGRRGDLLMRDLLMQVIVETPKHLTKRQEELFRELAEIDHKHVSPERKSFMEKLKSLFASDGTAETPDASKE